MINPSRRAVLAASASLAALPVFARAQALTASELRTSFADPPSAAKPYVWWHWMNGNVTSDGARADLEWMKRVGIGGVQNFDASLRAPQIVERRLTYLSPEWRTVMRESVMRAEALGLEFAIAGSPGFSTTGGPWVQPEQAMKKLVWSETTISGGRRFEGRLAQPPSIAGPFGNIPATPFLGGDAPGSPPALYRDQAVIAYRSRPQDRILNREASITSSATSLDAAKLSDGDLAEAVELPVVPGSREAWVLFDFSEAQTARALSFVFVRGTTITGMADGPEGRVEASDDGVNFREIAQLPRSGADQLTVAFPPTRARQFRISIRPTGRLVRVAQLVLHGGARVDQFENKAGFALNATGAIVESDREGVISLSDIVDLTDRVGPDGALAWTPPPGQWVVLRLGYSLTGVFNHPATAEGMGLEVDKLNRTHVRAHLDAYLGRFEELLGRDLIGSRGLRAMVLDSYESGPQNWTDGMFDRFAQRRGYDLRDWAPVLTGRVVESPEASERVLWDFRQTLSDLIADEHYGEISAGLKRRGMLQYGEAHEGGRAFVGDGMAAKKSADIPMGAMWANRSEEQLAAYDADLRESASVAHIYGKTIVAAEAFTALGQTYAYDPQALKPAADRMMCNGVNRFVIHASVHQPLDRPGPDLGLGPVGQWFTRKETWAEQAGAWTAYLARSSHLLQQGTHVADIAYLYGEDSNIAALFAEPPRIPEGFDFDYLNADALIGEISVANGELVARSGMRYAILALDASTQRMSMPLLRKIAALAASGATIVGPRPQALANRSDGDAAFARLVERTWRRDNVSEGNDLSSVLAAKGRAPDFAYAKPLPDTKLAFVHRALPDGEIYFVSSKNDRAQTVEASFRTAGRAPELWRADNGAIEPASYRTESGRTIVTLSLEPNDAIFVVFRETTAASSRAVPIQRDAELLAIETPWNAAFNVRSGARNVRFDHLRSWTEISDPEIKFFSGTATYTNAFEFDGAGSDERVLLDLGDVKNIAEVVLNDQAVGIAWKRPFRLDITDAVRTGRNQLEIKVVNLWPNRLIGDKQPGAGEPQAWAVYNPFTATSALLDSGLLGPVRILARR